MSKLIPIGTVWDNGKFEDMPDTEDYFTFKSDDRKVINPGGELPLKKKEAATLSRFMPLTMTCMGTRKTFIPPPKGASSNKAICKTGRPKDRDGSDNANGVVMLLEFETSDSMTAEMLPGIRKLNWYVLSI